MSDELMRVLPYPWPCVMCGRELTSLYHEPSLPVAMGGPGPSGHLFVPLLGCSIHGSDRAPLMAMTATPHPAPDSRPRCGGTPGKPGVFVTTRNALNSVLPATEDCKGCPDCAQPAPTPSGDDGARWRCSRCGEYRVVTAVVGEGDEGVSCTVEPPCAGLVDCERNGVSDLHAPDEMCPGPEGAAWCPFDGADDYGTQDVEAVLAIKSAAKKARAESAAALSATNRELSALSSDKQALMTATTHWRERAEATESRLRAATARAERAETQARGHEVGLMHAERMGVEVPIYPDIAAWVNVILVADLIDEEIEERKKDASDGAVAILTIVGRMLRHALNTCRDCGSPEGYHYPDCAALSATEEEA